MHTTYIYRYIYIFRDHTLHGIFLLNLFLNFQYLKLHNQNTTKPKPKPHVHLKPKSMQINIFNEQKNIYEILSTIIIIIVITNNNNDNINKLYLIITVLKFKNKYIFNEKKMQL